MSQTGLRCVGPLLGKHPLMCVSVGIHAAHVSSYKCLPGPAHVTTLEVAHLLSPVGTDLPECVHPVLDTHLPHPGVSW